MRFRKCLQACALALVVASAPAGASSATSEITDTWWNPSESGWGVNVILQNNVAFLTFLVYDATHTPIWYTSDAYLGDNFAWTGKLYQTTGPWFGGPFPPANVALRQVGTVSFAVTASNQATLTYTVDGVTVTKTVERQTWANENYTGNYLGGYSVSGFTGRVTGASQFCQFSGFLGGVTRSR